MYFLNFFPVFTAYYFQSLPPEPMPAPVAPPPAPNRLLQATWDLVLALRPTGEMIDHVPTRDFAHMLPADGVVEGRLFAEGFPDLAENFPLPVREFDQAIGRVGNYAVNRPGVARGQPVEAVRVV